jgi:hypothetical protein
LETRFWLKENSSDVWAAKPVMSMFALSWFPVDVNEVGPFLFAGEFADII